MPGKHDRDDRTGPGIDSLWTLAADPTGPRDDGVKIVGGHRTRPRGFLTAADAAAIFGPSCSLRGCSSVVERHVANVNVVGSSPITRCDVTYAESKT